DPEHYVFPISRRDAYQWHMEESSQMFAYYGHASYMRGDAYAAPGGKYYRSHEGIDFDLHDARGLEKHPLVSMASGRVCLAEETNDDEVCLIIQSKLEPDIYYVYQHVNRRFCFVRE